MHGHERLSRSITIVLAILLYASAARAQTGTAGIAGVARDPSGAVLPGVTVEAASPALIEKTRTVVTDGEGQYKFVSLPPGVYSVTFSLEGFTSFKRDGVELTSNFTATVNGDLKVGSLQETVTVSGQSPVVDVQNVATRNQISRETLDTVPTNKTLEAYAALTPGVTMGSTGQDVGGSKGETYVILQIHGTRQGDAKTLIDGFETNDWSGRVFVPNPAASQEVSVDLGNGLAEAPAHGVYVNYIPKSGANTFNGSFIANWTGSGMQSAANLTDDLKARGLTQSALPQINKIWDTNGSFGGPLKRDKIWFFTALRSWGSEGTVVGTYYTATQGTPFRYVDGQYLGDLSGGNPFIYAPDKTRPAINDFNQWIWTSRGTFQLSPRNKLEASYDWEYRCDCHRSVSPNLTPEASGLRTYHPKIPTVTWTFTATKRMLIEAGTATEMLNYGPAPQPGVPIDTIPVLEQTGNVQFLATPGDSTVTSGYGNKRNLIQNSRAAVSYVTGSHSIRVGMQIRTGYKNFDILDGSPINYRVQNGVPNQVTLYAYPLVLHNFMNALMGVYAQDQWTMKRLTLSGGIRYDYENAEVPAQHLDAGAFIPARDFAQVKCVPCWNDINPRVSAAYDLFGNGKTAVKFSYGRYVAENILTTADLNNPVLASNSSTTRSWTDSNHNYIPDCDLVNPALNGECGAMANQNFGKTIITNHFAPDVIGGNRPYNWATSFGIQQEVHQGVAVSFGYFHTSWHNFSVADNQDQTSADFSPYCITLPNDPLIPNAGQQLCGLYDVNPDKFGINRNVVVRQLSGIGSDASAVYEGIDITTNARLGRGAFVQGGMSTGRETTTACTVVDNPSQAATLVFDPAARLPVQVTSTTNIDPYGFCKVQPPFYMPQWKFSGSYPLPFYGIQLSAVYQNLPGIPIRASLIVPNSLVKPSLGRDLSGNATNVTIANIIAPLSKYEPRIQQFDLRVIKNFRIQQMRLQGTFDVYNLLNRADVLSEVTQYGTTWRNPTSLLDARIFKVGVQMTF
jgi:hypothetical protein